MSKLIDNLIRLDALARSSFGPRWELVEHKCKRCGHKIVKLSEWKYYKYTGQCGTCDNLYEGGDR